MSAKYKKIYTKIVVSGIVQGVGFRPFIYRIAQDFGVNGWVRNRGGSVEILLDSQDPKDFITAMVSLAPISARIDNVRTSVQECDESLNGFAIIESQKDALGLESKIPKDMAICPDCLKEMHDGRDRHYRYAFTTCTNCGPRYSIISSLPYDRKNTSMASFLMCEDCQNEYNDPSDRRFGAQPNSCLKCAIPMKFYTAGDVCENEPIQKCAQAILNGEIVAIKGVGGFALVCDGRNTSAVERLREKKHRPKKPFALMAKDLPMALEFVRLDDKEISALKSNAAPIVLAKKKYNPLLAPAIAPSLDTLGVILPYSGIHHLLFDWLDFPIVFTSANVSGEPIITSLFELNEKLGDVFTSVLDYEREILHPIDDSVMAMLGGEMGVIRLGRGLAPLDIELFDPNSTDSPANTNACVPDCAKQVDNAREKSKSALCVGMGAEQKSSLTYVKDNKYLISPFIGDLNNPASICRYEEIFELFSDLYALNPDVLIHDNHPNYHSSILSAKKSLQLPANRISIQHHRAHFCAVFAEAMLQDKAFTPQTKALGIIWDGTGLGDDGLIWGGEVFLGNLTTIERVGHFETLPLIGGEGAIKNIYKIGYGLALQYGLKGLIERFEEGLPKHESTLLKTMFEKNTNTISTTSVGRLFDGVASLCGLLGETTYEGEAGMILESLANTCDSQDCYSFEISNDVVIYAPMLLEIQKDILSDFCDGDQIAKKMPDKVDKNAMLAQNLATKRLIAKKFINTLAQIAFAWSEKYPEMPVIFSGGVFQNKLLCERVQRIFEKNGRKFYMHRLLPPNDACISFGQAVFAQYNAPKENNF
ncbi:carbamoyltransferase HypF [Helicobacter sp. 11S02596-1]|uniref:carbamoyltransferase HypF n=1 Tax=Helicobacter sp. 11S02596-1 TaxID=1476194 RepID=UPI0015DEC125|nr:carbamoyltransferase HypF [Helicobacter sp. 11S02596-1]